MDGYVTLVHLFMYVLVAGTMLQTQQQWTWFWYTSLMVATAVAIHGLGQHLGWFEGEGSRIAGRLGNAAYLAIYMLFHVFLTFYLFVRDNRLIARIIYTAIAILMVYVLLETGTRGTAIGLAVGVGVMTAYIALFATRYPQFRAYAIGACALFALIIGGFLAARDTQMVQDSHTLSRIANINLAQDLEVRGAIWNIAWQGVQERPVLGWGQENFNFVFNQYYDPFLYDQEQWFDRVHNIFLDWLIAGGVLGLVAYMLLFSSAVYYVTAYTYRSKDAHGFSVLEQGVLLGLLTGYLTHNLVVFDNIVSYIFFASVIAMVHSRVSRELPIVREWYISKNTVRYTLAPVVLVIAAATIYYTNIPSLQAAADVITAMRSNEIEERQKWFNRAFEQAGKIGQQEISEQMAQSAIRVISSGQVPDALRQSYINQTESMLNQVAREKPGDARIHVFRGSFYRGIGALGEARSEFARARELSPNKQSIIMQQGIVELQSQELESARNFFAEAFKLYERNDLALQFLITTLYRMGEVSKAQEYMESREERFWRNFALDDYAFQSVVVARDVFTLSRLFEYRIEQADNDPQVWISYAVTMLEIGDTNQAVDILRNAAVAMPEFATTANCFADNIEAGREPDDGCS